MTTLVLLLPPRDLGRQPSEWQLGALPFVLFSESGQQLQAGRASLALMPAARRHILLVAPSDVVLLRTAVPALKGPRLRLALPNLIEEQLVTDAARSHVAVGPPVEAGAERLVAVVDRSWMRFILERFVAEERGGLRVVPALVCLPGVAAGEVAVTQFSPLGEIDPQDGRICEIALQDARGECGLRVNQRDLESTAEQFAGSRPIVLRRLAGPEGVVRKRAMGDEAGWAARLESLEFAALARHALSADLDLCQFEFATQVWQRGRSNLKRWRVPIALAAAIAVVSVLGLNIDWIFLARERQGLDARATDLLLTSFPKTKVVLDAPLQMSRELDSLRNRAGESESGDFLVLCDRLARALGPMGPASLASVDYVDHALTVALVPGVKIDPQWPERLARVGLKAESSGGKWIIRSLA